ncbi:hypothetical protein LR48_Vigan07g211800 [Vigna angularis]|uniref:Uncharacterized protein n=1 Tax=Phaseolus angularis TaxID=3914 RepID=A0A0L9V0Y3_PHAAN|nr:hypothetical protein LR48_Vigan07g211800 [Vigna angularis]
MRSASISLPLGLDKPSARPRQSSRGRPRQAFRSVSTKLMRSASTSLPLGLDKAHAVGLDKPSARPRQSSRGRPRQAFRSVSTKLMRSASISLPLGLDKAHAVGLDKPSARSRQSSCGRPRQAFRSASTKLTRSASARSRQGSHGRPRQAFRSASTNQSRQGLMRSDWQIIEEESGGVFRSPKGVATTSDTGSRKRSRQRRRKEHRTQQNECFRTVAAGILPVPVRQKHFDAVCGDEWHPHETTRDTPEGTPTCRAGKTNDGMAIVAVPVVVENVSTKLPLGLDKAPTRSRQSSRGRPRQAFRSVSTKLMRSASISLPLGLDKALSTRPYAVGLDKSSPINLDNDPMLPGVIGK